MILNIKYSIIKSIYYVNSKGGKIIGYIKEKEIIKNKIKLSKAPIKLDKYDMYYIKFQMRTGSTKIVKAFCEKGTFPDFYSEEFKKIQQDYGKNINWSKWIDV